ncbi:MAG: hypothetical protein HY272_11780 [Gammaproteobacteria bacterium]|nr:hypothetical protein [Gammaproteobacteria bacterium]
MGPFAPGAHVVSWKVTDLALNVSPIHTQTITVQPHVNLVADQTVGGNGASSVVVTAVLDGNAATYPVTIPFTVGGTASYVAPASPITIAAGTSGTATFTINSGNANGSTVLVTLGAPINAIKGTKSTHTITITTANLPPVVTNLATTQGGPTTRILVTNNTGVTLAATASDPNPGDTINYDWSSSDASIIAAATSGTTGNTFSFNPAGLAPGYYTAKVTVTDNHGASSRRDITLSVVAVVPTLSTTVDTDDDDLLDNTDGYDDTDNDGIPNYLDAISASNLLQGDDLTSDSTKYYVSGLKDSKPNPIPPLFITWTITTASSNKVFYPLLLRTTPGLKLQLGPLAVRQGVSQAHISSAKAIAALGVSPGANLISADGNIVDVEISGLSPGATAHLVIPQPAPIPTATGTPATTNFKQFTASNTWIDFTSSGSDSVKSAGKETTSFFCPPPAHSAYTTGNLANKECVELTITDGGPNDADGIVNGSVRVLGSVFISTSDTTTAPGLITTPGDISARNDLKYKNNAGEGGGGIGALWWELLLPTLLIWQRQKIQRGGAETRS